MNKISFVRDLRTIAKLLVMAGALALAACQTTVPTGQTPVQGQQAPSRPVQSESIPPPPPSGTTTGDIQGAPSQAPLPVGSVARVAALLPLTGPNAAVGRALLDAMQMALFDARDAPIELLPRDTGGTVEGARRAADNALAAGARLVLGPLLGDEVPAVADVVSGAGVPILSFTNNTAVARPGVYVLGLIPQMQVERITSYAHAKGARRFAALLPNNALGRTAEESYRNVVTRLGGELVAIERYEPQFNAISAAAEKLAAAEKRSAARRPGGAGPGFDAVLLPDFGERLLMAGALLPYNEIDTTKVRVLGTALWDDPNVAREQSLTNGFFAAPAPEQRNSFTQRFKQSYGRDPPRLATLGYDVAALAAVLAKSAGGPDFSTAALTNPNGFAGYDGIFRLRSDGLSDRRLPILQVQRGGFRIVEAAPNRFEDLTQ